jgi:hypothetical protein
MRVAHNDIVIDAALQPIKDRCFLHGIDLYQLTGIGVSKDKRPKDGVGRPRDILVGKGIPLYADPHSIGIGPLRHYVDDRLAVVIVSCDARILGPHQRVIHGDEPALISRHVSKLFVR